MGTRSSIAIKNNNNTVDAVYCHWDGYLDHNGKILIENYNTANKLKALLAFGDISSLGKDLGPITREQPFNSRFTVDPTSNECIFYKRDYKESGEHIDCKHYSSIETWLQNLSQEYNYMFDTTSAKWFLAERTRMGYTLTQLSDAIKEEA